MELNCEQIFEVAESGLHRYAQENPKYRDVEIREIAVVGSYGSEEFVEGESDLDLAIGVVGEIYLES